MPCVCHSGRPAPSVVKVRDVPASEGMRHRGVVAGALPGFQDPCCERCGDCRLPACVLGTWGAWSWWLLALQVLVHRARSEREGRLYTGVSVVSWKLILDDLLEENGSV